MQGPRWSGETLAWAGLFAVVAVAHWVQRFWQVSIAGSSVYGRAAVDWRQRHARGPEGWREAAEIFREMVQPQATVFMNYAAAVLPLRHGGWRESEHKGICKRK
jgi:hypothetical protein